MVDAVLVEPDGLVTTGGSPRSGRGRILAVAVAVVATGLFLIAGTSDRSDGEMPGRDLIQAYLDAWYGGDFDTAASLRAPERVRTGPSEDRARGEVEYQAILGARAELLDCEPLPPATVRCDVAYSNALNQAAGAAPAVVAQQSVSGMVSSSSSPGPIWTTRCSGPASGILPPGTSPPSTRTPVPESPTTSPRAAASSSSDTWRSGPSGTGWRRADPN